MSPLCFSLHYSFFGFWCLDFEKKNKKTQKENQHQKEKAENTSTLLSLTLLLLFPRSQALPFGPLRESSILISNQGFCCCVFFVWLWCLVSVFLYYLSASAMEDSAKLRLVKCPKCQNVLPEHANYTVYQCGGCGTVLRGTLS